MKTMTRAAAAFLACLFLAGCQLLPRKADLDVVHDAYRADFAGYAKRLTVETPAMAGCPDATAFDNTLDAIRRFEAKYRDETGAEMGHVAILKGMIHLQAGNFGIARDLKSSVATANISATDDRAVRDALFKSAYDGLLDGWQATCESIHSGSEIRDGLSSVAPGKKRSEVLATAADELEAVVVKAASPKSRPGAEADDGAVFLATTAGIFRYYRFRMDKDGCDFGGSACLRAAADRHEKVLGQSAAQIFALLTDVERKFAADEAAKPCSGPPATEQKGRADDWRRSVSSGRQRYLDWYLALARKGAC